MREAAHRAALPGLRATPTRAAQAEPFTRRANAAPSRPAALTTLTTLITLGTLVIVIMLGGCALVLQPPQPGPEAAAAVAELDQEVFGIPMPATPRAAVTVAPSLAIDRWWPHFGDPALDALIEGALQRNADLGIAVARLREARAQLDEVRGAQRPSVELQASTGRARTSADALGVTGVPGRTGASHRVALAAQHEVDLWGRLAAGTDAARARLASQAWARASIEWGLTAQLAEVHFGLRGLQRQLEIAEAVRVGREQTVTLRRAGLAGGVGSEFELRRAEAELAAAESTLATLHRQRLALESARALLAGTPLAQFTASSASSDLRAAVAPLDPTAAFEARLPQGDIATLLLRRPDLRQAEAQLAASRADIQAARAAALPSLRLSGSVGSDVRDIANLFNAPGFAWSLAAGAAQSLVDGGRNAARVEQAQARSDAALLAYRQSVATALTDLREAYAAFDTAEQALAAERRRVAALAQAQRLAQLGHEAGALPQLDALDAERNHFQAQLAEVDAYRERLLVQVAAFKALGGGHGGAPEAGAAAAPAAAAAAPAHAIADAAESGRDPLGASR